MPQALPSSLKKTTRKRLPVTTKTENRENYGNYGARHRLGHEPFGDEGAFIAEINKQIAERLVKQGGNVSRHIGLSVTIDAVFDKPEDLAQHYWNQKVENSSENLNANFPNEGFDAKEHNDGNKEVYPLQSSIKPNILRLQDVPGMSRGLGQFQVAQDQNKFYVLYPGPTIFQPNIDKFGEKKIKLNWAFKTTLKCKDDKGELWCQTPCR